MEQKQHPGEKREKFYTVSARLVFSSVLVILIVAIILSVSVAINNGPVLPLLGIHFGNNTPASAAGSNDAVVQGSGRFPTTPLLISITCSPTSPIFGCINPILNTSTGIFTVAIKQTSGYNWTRVTVMFVTAGTTYAESGVPILSWSPPEAVNVTGGLLNNTLKYINIPISSGPIAVGTNITGSIWAKYQLGIGKAQFYANISSATIVVKR